MNNEIENVLLIFIKNPQKGNVKTRLAQTVGDEKALEVYHKLLKRTREITSGLRCDRQVWYSSFIEHDDIWSSENFEKRLQKGKDLGERMSHAFERAFIDGYKKVVIIGSDCADINGQFIEQAFHKLENSDVVVGPAQDGGYYLLGMREFHPDLFAGIDWSTSSVFQQTVKRIKEKQRSIELLPILNDIDTEDDLATSDLNID